jgi:6-pyruvoyltetrahydropterin/6-carboxytetrahydropterin synthase
MSHKALAVKCTMTSNISITRRLEFDAGHRLPNHLGQCRNIHGHRYAIEITLSGDLINEQGAADDGMVMDFGDIKAIANEKLVDLWDHAFIVHRGDKVMVDFLNAISGHKTVVLDVVPTAENLASVAFAILKDAYHDRYGHTLALLRVRLYETPNCWADAVGTA